VNKRMMLKTILATTLATSGSMLHGIFHREDRKPHWKELQSKEEREEKLRKAEEKRRRKALKKKGMNV